MIENIYENDKKIPDSIEEYIRGLIISGELLPGTKLDDRAVAEQYAIGSTSVRSAFSILCYDGFMSFSRGEGFRVEKITKEDIIDLFYLAETLLKASFKSIKYSTSMITLLSESIRRTDELDLCDMEQKFHVTVALASRNQEYIQASRKVYQKIRWYNNLAISPIFDESLLDEHKLLVDEFINNGDRETHFYEDIAKHFVHHVEAVRK